MTFNPVHTHAHTHAYICMHTGLKVLKTSTVVAHRQGLGLHASSKRLGVVAPPPWQRFLAEIHDTAVWSMNHFVQDGKQTPGKSVIRSMGSSRAKTQIWCPCLNILPWAVLHFLSIRAQLILQSWEQNSITTTPLHEHEEASTTANKELALGYSKLSLPV